eukprot:gnl/Chilomastix_cuspidata/2975.p1 GENE.gnl/Chilomastix_cuspidata/2975~~gnl/Chilomastix_cuspidata/2975.p1  ORF type:complete len:350 (+),score=112.66 gnl/Chilomastix_cuspidata/2975:591-1640(+)
MSSTVDPQAVARPHVEPRTHDGACGACLAKTSKRLFCCFSHCGESLMVILCTLLILGITASMFYCFIFSFLKDSGLVLQCTFGAVTGYIGLMALFHYYMVVFRGRRKAARGESSPWTARPPMPYEVDALPLKDDTLVGVAESGIRACSKCGRLRPLRTHHCSSCRTCYVRFDHHCPWVAGCVAAHNYAHFWLFLLWAVVGCAYACVTILLSILRTWQRYISDLSAREMVLTMIAAIMMFFALIMGIATATLFVFHVRLLRRNQTTLEDAILQAAREDARARGQAVRVENPFDLGSAHANAAEVFGRRLALKLLLPLPVRPPRDLLRWERLRHARIVRDAAEPPPAARAE